MPAAESSLATTISPSRAAATAEDRPDDKRLGGAATVASDPKLLQLVLNHRFSVLVLGILAAEGVTGSGIYRADSATERMVAESLFAGVLLVGFVLFALLVFRRTEIESAAVPVVPGNLTQAATAVPAEQADNLLNHTDGTFAFAQPPSNWSMRTTTLLELASTTLRRQRFGVPEELGKRVPFKAGPMLMLREQHVYSIHYLPGRSTMNGRPVLAVLDETHSDFVQIFSVSKAGTTMRNITAEHLFALFLMEKVQIGARVTSIRENQVGAQSRTVLRASAELALDHVSIDGGPPQKATLSAQLQLVERGEFILVITSAVLCDVPSAPARLREIEAIIASITPRPTVDAEDRGRRERELSDAEWTEAVREALPGVLAAKATAIVQDAGTLEPQALIRAAEEVAQLTAYGHAMPDLVPPELTQDLDRWSAALKAATTGDRSQMDALLAELAAARAVAACV